MDHPDVKHIRFMATLALYSAVREDQTTAQIAVGDIYKQYGDPGLLLALLAWLDTTIAHTCTQYQPGQMVELIFHSKDHTKAISADSPEAQPEVVWAGRIMVARLQRDEGMFEALLDAISDEDWLRYIIYALFVYATQLDTQESS